VGWVNGVLVKAIASWQRRVAGRCGVAAGASGAVTFVQRFGGAR
jgi:hypothetical protein